MSAFDLSVEARAALYHPNKYSILAPLNLDPETAFVAGVVKVRPENDGLYVFELSVAPSRVKEAVKLL